jgi:RNA polymerase sigma-70 factor (ECF subfamily)
VVEVDEQVLQRWRAGDEAAFEELFLRHYGQVFRVLFNLLGSREEAEDLAQETFIALHNQPPPHVETSMAAWLCRVALNRGYNALRGARRAQQRLERMDPLPLPVDPQAALLRAEEQGRVRGALAQLAERQSNLLLLRHSGLSYAEIAGVLDVAPGSVGTLLARAERAFLAAFNAHKVIEHDGLAKAKTP